MATQNAFEYFAMLAASFLKKPGWVEFDDDFEDFSIKACLNFVNRVGSVPQNEQQRLP